VNAAKNKKPITEEVRASKAAQMKQEVLNRIEEMKDMETFEHMEMLKREQEKEAQINRRKQKEEKRKNLEMLRREKEEAKKLKMEMLIREKEEARKNKNNKNLKRMEDEKTMKKDTSPSSDETRFKRDKPFVRYSPRE